MGTHVYGCQTHLYGSATHFYECLDGKQTLVFASAPRAAGFEPRDGPAWDALLRACDALRRDGDTLLRVPDTLLRVGDTQL